MAERQLPKLNVAGSIPVSRSKPFAHIPRTHKKAALSSAAFLLLLLSSYFLLPTSAVCTFCSLGSV